MGAGAVLVAVLEEPAAGAAPPEPAVTEVAPGVRDVPEGLSAPEPSVRLGVVPITLVPTPVEPVRPVPENVFESKPAFALPATPLPKPVEPAMAVPEPRLESPMFELLPTAALRCPEIAVVPGTADVCAATDPEVAEPAPVAAAPVLRPSSSRQEANAIAKQKSIAVLWTFLTAILLIGGKPAAKEGSCRRYRLLKRQRDALQLNQRRATCDENLQNFRISSWFVAAGTNSLMRRRFPRHG